MMPTQLVLIRHGITDWNIERRYCGDKNIPLSLRGRRQAKKLAEELKGAGFDRIYSSNKKRALETSRIIFGRKKIIKLSSLREINFGVLEGMRHERIIKECGKVYTRWLRNPYANQIPKAERMADFRERVKSAIRTILRINPDKKIAIVCHGGVIGIFLSSLLKSNKFWRYVPSAGTITIVEYRNKKAKIKQFNQTKIQTKWLR